MAAVVTFFSYALVYAFRKPFTVSEYTGAPGVFGLPYKDALIIAQVLGYMLSKFYGIKFIAELKRIGRAKLILLLVSVAWIALLIFAVTPAPYNIIFLFINGFPLGMIWGVIFTYVEGRKTSDFIGAALAVSFIFSSGFVKSIAKTLQLSFNISDWFLPFITGLVFILPLIFFLYLLEQIPPPSASDVALRVERQPMARGERKLFFSKFGFGLISLIVVYVLLTVFRDIRDNFAADIWQQLGFGDQPSIFTTTEIPITILVLILIASMMLIRNNAKAFLITHFIIIAGFAVAGISSWFFLQDQLSPFWWMLLVGLGLYMGYIPFNCILFDRMIATFRINGNVGFLMYVADSFGYLGSVILILAKSYFLYGLRWSVLYPQGVIMLTFFGIAGTVISIFFFRVKIKKSTSTMAPGKIVSATNIYKPSPN